MKKVGLFVASLMLAGSLAMAADPVYSVNGVGYVKVAVPAGSSIVSLPFNSVGGSALTLDQAFGSVFADNTTLYFYDAAASKYVTYIYLAGDGWYDEASQPAGSSQVLRGEGFWIVTDVATNLTIAGEIPGTANGTNTVPIQFGAQMISFAYPAPGALSNGSFSPADNDTIYEWTGSAYKSYTYIAGDGWYDESPALIDLKLDIGKGYWYVSQDASSKAWAQVKPYVWP